jgi:hypothetical protein
MIGAAILLAQAMTVAASQEHYVRLDEHRWATPEAARPEKLGNSERLWHWSERCAPAAAEGVTIDAPCGAVKRLTASVTKAHCPLASAEIVWGTRALIEEVPEALLPRATTGEDGLAVIAAPADAPVYVRVTGPRDVTEWRKVEARADHIQLAGVAATDIAITAVDERQATALRVRALVAPADTNSDDLPIFAAADKGTVRFRRPAAGSSRITLWSDTSAPAERTDDNQRLGGTIVLPRGCAIRGTLVASHGTAIDGATVADLFPLGTTGRATRRRISSFAASPAVLRFS